MENSVSHRLEIELKKVFYSFEKYNALSTFALIHHEAPIDPETLSKYLRVSDIFLALDEHTYFINFAFTSHEDAFKAAQNILYGLDNYFNDTSTYIAIKELDPSNTPKMLVNKLLQILKETRKHSYSRVEDESILNTTF